MKITTEKISQTTLILTDKELQAICYALNRCDENSKAPNFNAIPDDVRGVMQDIILLIEDRDR